MGAYKFCDLEETQKTAPIQTGLRPNGERYTAKCRSGCPSSRAATMGYLFEGRYWKKKGSHRSNNKPKPDYKINPVSGKAIARCSSGCPSARAASLGYMFEGKYWKLSFD